MSSWPPGNSSAILINTSSEKYQINGLDKNFFRHSNVVTAVLVASYTFVFVVGFVGNYMVLDVVRRCRRMKSTTNYFIANLALADLLVIIVCVPATLTGNIITPWVLGSFSCKAVSYLQGVSVSASINTLVAVSADRFFAICYPLKCQFTMKIARRIIMLIWIFSLLLYVPWPMHFTLVPITKSRPDILICVEKWPHERIYFLVANLGLCYLLPLVVISGCYAGIWLKVTRRHIPGETKGTNADAVMQRSKLKVVKMLVIVVVVFALSWLPLYIIFFRIKIGGPIEGGTLESSIIVIAIPIAQWLGSSNSCINPLLYAFFNKKFRKGFLAIIKSKKCCGTLRYEAPVKRTTKTTVV